jgi:hypothetical protein
MGVPFLHRFRTSNAGFTSGSRSLRETICDWPLSLVGPQGPQMLQFRIIGIGEAAPRAAGVFIYARRKPDGQWQALFIGETANLRNRLSFNEIAADALLSGATDIHVLLTGSDASARRDTCERMVRTNNPLLNESRVKPPAATAPSRQGRRTNAA